VQLKNSKSISKSVAALTAALLGTTVTGASAQNHQETSILIYSEKNRIRATEGNFTLSKMLRNDYTLNLRFTYDGLTGATPTGASPSKYAQTITRASGGKTISVPAGEHPVDNSFKDTRFAAEAGLSRPLGRLNTLSFGAHASSEHDYTSLGINGGIARDFNRRNTTIGLSLAIARDVSKPVGGYHEPFSDIDAEIEDDRETRLERFSGKKRNVYDVIVSLTQVMDRQTLLVLNLSLNRANGYLTDPYKIISVVQAPDGEDPGEPATSIFENRPDSRSKNAVFAELRRNLGRSTAGLQYRYFWDSWGVAAHSIDATMRFDFNKRGAIHPRVRWYHQSEADVYQPFLVQGVPLPAYASSDSRLAAFDAYTFGMTYSVPVKNGSRLNLTAEYYAQRGDSSPPEAYGSLLTFDLFPKLDVIMLRVGYERDY